MRINMCGGVLTMPYQLAKHLLEKNVDVKLFINPSPEDESYSPIWEEEEIQEGGLPGWIHKESFNLFRYFLMSRAERKFLNRLADCDLIHAHGESCIWASFTKKPYLFQSYGFDLDYMPFHNSSLKLRILSFLMRRGIKKASHIFLSPYQIPAIGKLGISNNKYSKQYWGIDVNKYKRVNTTLGKEIRDKFKVDLIFF